MNEDKRLETLEKQRIKTQKKFKQSVSKRKVRLPGELIHKKQLAVVLRVAGYDLNSIGASVNESLSTIESWFREGEVKDNYNYMLQHLVEGAVTLLRTYTIEAIQTIAEIMQNTEDEKIALDAAKEILDRGGIPKISKSEAHTISEKKTTFTDDGIVDKLRELPPEYAEEAAQMVEKLEGMLSEADAKSSSQKNS